MSREKETALKEAVVQLLHSARYRWGLVSPQEAGAVAAHLAE